MLKYSVTEIANNYIFCSIRMEMLMKAIRLQRFKGFIDSGWIDLNPVTLLFGYNSSGKSSILKALLMLKQSLENPSLEVPFVFTAEKGIDLGSFEDAVNNHRINHNEPMIISLRVNIEDKINNKIALENYDIDFSINISYNQKRRFIAIMGFNLCDNNEKVILNMKKQNPSQNAKEVVFSEYYEDLNEDSVKIEWYNFLPVIKDINSDLYAIKLITEAVRESIIDSLKNLSNIGPVRAIPERNQLFTGVSPLNVGVHGEEAFKLLYLDRYRDDPQNLDEKVNRFLSKHNYKFEWKIFKNSLGQFILIDIRSG